MSAWTVLMKFSQAVMGKDSTLPLRFLVSRISTVTSLLAISTQLPFFDHELTRQLMSMGHVLSILPPCKRTTLNGNQMVPVVSGSCPLPRQGSHACLLGQATDASSPQKARDIVRSHRLRHGKSSPCEHPRSARHRYHFHRIQGC